MARVPGGFGVNNVMGVRRPSRAVSLDDDRNPESVSDQELFSLISDQRGDESDEPYFDWAQPGVDRVLGGLGRMFEYADAPGRELLREPLSAAMTYASLNEARGTDDLSDLFDWDQWRESYGIAQDRSIGQSVALAALSSGEEGNRVTDPEFLMRHQEGMERDPEGGWQEIPDNDSRWRSSDPQAAYKTMSAGTDAAFRIFADPLNAAARVVMRGVHLLTAGRTTRALDRGVASGRLLDPERFVSFEGVDGAKLVDDMRSARATPDVLQQQADVVVDGVMNPVTAGENTIWTRDVFGFPTQKPSAMPPRRGDPTSGTDAALIGAVEDLGWGLPESGAGTGNPTSALNHFLSEAGRAPLQAADEAAVLGMVRNDLQEIVVRSADDLGLGDEISVLRSQIAGAEIGPSVSTRPIGAGPHPPRHSVQPAVGGPQSAGRDLDIIEAVVNPRTDILASMDLRAGGYGNLGEAEALIDPAVLAAKTRFQGPLRTHSPLSGVDVQTGGIYEALYGPGIHDVPAFGTPKWMFIRKLLNERAASAAPLSPEFGKVIPGLKTADQILGVPGAAALETAMLDSARRSRERRGPQ